MERIIILLFGQKLDFEEEINSFVGVKIENQVLSLLSTWFKLKNPAYPVIPGGAPAPTQNPHTCLRSWVDSVYKTHIALAGLFV